MAKQGYKNTSHSRTEAIRVKIQPKVRIQNFRKGAKMTKKTIFRLGIVFAMLVTFVTTSLTNSVKTVLAQGSDPGVTVSGSNWVGDGSCEVAGAIRWFRGRYVSSQIKFVGECPTPVVWHFYSPDRSYSGSTLLNDADGEEFLIGG
ncbi:MAG: hypothetical protein AAB638_03370, partial [Patescibacteria group bacterium]